MRRNGRRALMQAIVGCLVILFASAAVQAESLKEEFDKLCVYTQDAESLPLAKLQELVAECDKLKEKIEQSSDRQKKLLLFRLKKCRNFLAYIMEHKQQADSNGSQ